MPGKAPRVPVLDPGRKQTKAGRLWVFVGDREHPHTVYDSTATKARGGPAAILKNYRGFLRLDRASDHAFGACVPCGWQRFRVYAQ